MARSFALVLALALAVSLGAGCLDHEDDRVQFGEDFEGCGGCSWTFAGDITIVTTVHPGEHAARMGAGARMSHGLEIVRAFDVDGGGWDEGGFTDGNWLEYSSDCADRPGLALEPFGADVQVRLRLEGAPGGDGFTRRRHMFPALSPSLGPPPDYPDDPYDPWQITFRNLVVESAGPCRIDNLRVMVSGGTLGY